jgi:hypothetical protein
VARDIRTAGGGRVDVFVADLSSQAQVRRLADEVLQRLPRIDVLVNRRIDFDDLQANGRTPAPRRTTSPSSPTSCSPTSWRAGCAVRR